VALRFQIELEFGNIGFLRREEKLEDPEKKPLEQGQEPTTDSTHICTGFGNRIWVTLVRGECSHHCTISAPLCPSVRKPINTNPGLKRGQGFSA